MNCVKCNNPLEEGINLCPECGKEYVICVNCGSHNEDSTGNCISCNKPVKDYVTNKTKKPALFVVIAVSVLSITYLTFLLLSYNKGPQNIMYIKNGAIYNKKANRYSTKRLAEIETLQSKENYNFFVYTCKTSEDGKKIFYPGESKINDGYIEYELLYTSNDSSDNKKIDDDVRLYNINNKGTLVYYMIGQQLYCSDIDKGTKTKIASYVDDYFINPDGSKVIYVKNRSIYLYDGKSSISIENEAALLEVSKDLNKIYYQQVNSLFLYEDGKKTLVAENMYYTHNSQPYIYPTGEIYYINNNRELYYYYNSKTIKISNNCSSIDMLNKNKPVILLYKEQTDDVYVVYKDKMQKIDYVKNTLFWSNNSGTSLYFMDQSGNLYIYDVLTNKSTLYEKNVYSFTFLKNSDKCIYHKLEQDNTYSLYIDKKKIASNVEVNLFSSSQGRGILCDSNENIIYTKVDNNKVSSALYLYNGKESIKVTDEYGNLYYYSPTAILYTKNHKDYKCDLYLFNGKKSRLIEKGVSTFLPVIKETYSNLYSFASEKGYDVEQLYFYVTFSNGLLI